MWEKSSKLGEPKLTSKTASLIRAIFLMLFIIITFGIGIAWALEKIKVNAILASAIASQIAIFTYGFNLFRFNEDAIKNEFKGKLSRSIAAPVVKSVIAIFIFNIILSLILSVVSLATTMNVDTFISNTTQDVIQSKSVLMMIILPVIVAPVIEELTFRAGLRYALVDWGSWKPWQYVIISSMLFGVLHWQPGSLAFIPMIVTCSVGVILSVAYIKTKNIYVSIFSHMIYNVIIIIIASS